MKILPLVRKEVKDLFKERVVLLGMIVGPLIMFAVLGGIMNVSFKAAVKEAGKPLKLAVMVLDTSEPAARLASYLEGAASHTVVVEPGDPVETLQRLYREEGVEVLVVVPEGFGANLTRGVPGVIEEYMYMSRLSFFGLPSLGRVSAYIDGFNKAVLLEAVKQVYPNATIEFVASPVVERGTVILFGKPVEGGPEEVMGRLFAQIFILPVMLLTAVMAALQVASVSMALEKEAKTLEMLLTLPVSRTEILLGKLAGVSLIAALGALSYTGGFLLYMVLYASSMPGAESMPLTFAVSPVDAVLYFLALLLGLLISIGIGILASVFVSDVKSAQVFSSYISLPLILPLFVFMFGVSLETLPSAVQVLLLLDPYVHLLNAFLGVASGDAVKAAMGYLGMLVYLAALLFAASRLFNSERILTARFSLRRRRGEEAP